MTPFPLFICLPRAPQGALDEAFVVRLSYEDLLRHPDESAASLVEHVGAPEGSLLRAQFYSFLQESSELFADKTDEDKWREGVSVAETELIEDMLGLAGEAG